MMNYLTQSMYYQMNSKLILLHKRNTVLRMIFHYLVSLIDFFKTFILH